jgi:hypothetical protein
LQTNAQEENLIAKCVVHLDKTLIQILNYIPRTKVTGTKIFAIHQSANQLLFITAMKNLFTNISWFNPNFRNRRQNKVTIYHIDFEFQQVCFAEEWTFLPFNDDRMPL